MTKRVYVIASFNPDGRVLPLWLRLSLDKAAPAYKIIDSKCVSMPNRYANYADFRCVATAGQHTHGVQPRGDRELKLGSGSETVSLFFVFSRIVPVN